LDIYRTGFRGNWIWNFSRVFSLIVRGPTDEEWKHMSPEQKRSYFIFAGIVLTILAVLLLERVFD
jgi:hypothetical protein